MSKARTMASGIRKSLGEIFFLPGEKKVFSNSFPAICLTDFTGTKEITDFNWPYLVSYLRSLKLELEGTTTFTGTSGTNTFTLDDADLAAAILEFAKSNSQQKGSDAETPDFTDLLTIDIGGTTYDISSISGSELTLSGTPTGTEAEIYPHKSTTGATAARLFSFVGKDLRGAGSSNCLSGIGWRDQMQGFGFANNGPISAETVGSLDLTGGTPTRGFGGPRPASVGTYTYRTTMGDGTALIGDDGTNGTPRIAKETRSAGVATHVYMWGEQYSGL